MGGNTMDTQGFWERVSTKQHQIAKTAQKYAGENLTNVAHHIDAEWMHCAYEMTRKDGAKGIDGVGAEEYAEDLEGRLGKLVDLLKSGKYRAPAVRRVYIPKAGSSEKRPLGIPTFEDKILQRAVQMVLEPIYEREFYDFSYGFRPGKSAHQALERIWQECMNMGGGYIIDMDISKYFDTIPHEKLREILGRRVSDGVVNKVIGKWLKAGIMEAGNLERSEAGTPQGGVISPILSNIYLHEVLDNWFVTTVKPRMKGKAFMVRYADDALIGCERKEDAERIFKVLSARFAKYGLTLHPQKTRLIDFTKPKSGQRKGSGSFTFLGFTHHWKKSMKGNWVIGRKTDRKRLGRAIKGIGQWCREHRDSPRKEQHQMLTMKLRGYYAYYGITFNFRSIQKYYHKVQRIWFKWLNRRSQQRSYNWERFAEYLRNYPLPKPRIVHGYS
jgi:group II intron reverse transcriptase/maturase